MPIPICIELPDPPVPGEIVLPGGVTIGALWTDINKIPNLCMTSLNLTAQLAPALAPLKPFFDLLDGVLQLVKCVEAIPDAISSFNPTPIFKCFPELAKKIDVILKLIPQLSVPLMIVTTIDNLITLIECTIGTFTNIIDQLAAIQARIEQASHIGDPNLDAILECANNDVAKLQMNAAEALAGVGTVIGILNLFLKLIGQPEIPSFGDIGSVDPEEALDQLNAIQKTLREIRRLIPVP